MASDHLPNRWGIAVAAVIMQIGLGAVYGWSVFVKPLIGVEHWQLTDVSLNFTLAIVFLGVGFFHNSRTCRAFRTSTD